MVPLGRRVINREIIQLDNVEFADRGDKRLESDRHYVWWDIIRSTWSMEEETRAAMEPTPSDT